jgi:hypothetical protein
MAKFETNLSKKDKMTIAIVLFVGVLFAFCWYLIKPAVTEIRTLSDDIEQAELLQQQYRNKIINLSSAETIFDKATDDLADSTSEFYEVMSSSAIDRMATSYVLSFGLFPEDLTINLPSTPVEEVPYDYSEAAAVQANNTATTPTPTPIAVTTSTGTASGTAAGTGTTPATSTMVDSLLTPYGTARMNATSTAAAGVMYAELTLVMTGDEAACQALIDDLCTKPSLRITGFEWLYVDPVEQYDEETGTVTLIDPDYTRLRVNIRLYMADVADYSAMVDQAVEAAGAEG